MTSNTVNYNMDFVEYLVKQELERREVAREPALSAFDLSEFRRQLIAKLIIQGNADAAIKLRPTQTTSVLLG